MLISTCNLPSYKDSRPLVNTRSLGYNILYKGNTKRLILDLILKKGGRLKCPYNVGNNLIMNNEFGLLRLKEVIKYTTLSKSTIYRRMRDNLFPRPVSCNGAISAWHVKDIKKYIERGGV